MSKDRFGLYFIPQDGELYQTGCAITGYDLRGQRAVPAPDWLNPDWRGSASNYGFHVTITDALYFNEGEELQTVTDEVRSILSCLEPSNQYDLTKYQAGFWADDRQDAAVLFTPNSHVTMLHHILVTAIQRGHKTEYTDALERDPEAFSRNNQIRINKTKEFGGPFIFERFKPHFTLLTAFEGSQEEQARVDGKLATSFASLGTLTFDSLALVVQKASEPHFKILEEFDLHAAR